MLLSPRQALNKAFLKVKPARSDIERFRAALDGMLARVNPAETEEFHKNLVSDFLNKTGFAPDHYINTKGRNDLVIHHAQHAKSPVAVILEAKSPANSAEMPRPDRLNAKALQELLLYYLRERITLNNLELRHLIVTNVHEWYIFDARDFETRFAHDRDLLRLFDDFETGRLAGNKTKDFYKDIAAPALEAALPLIPFVYVDVRKTGAPISASTGAKGANSNASGKTPSAPADAEIGAPVPSSPLVTRHSSLVTPLKLFSPTHLLKLPFLNDSNSLDKGFYSELLHIIGLTERKEGSTKYIERKPEGERDPGSLLENAITQLDSLDKLSRLERPSRYGADKNERLFNVALELAITWTNRILFLKLLEAQLIAYHKGDRDQAFLHSAKIAGYDELNSLFFEVLARLPAERGPEMRLKFARVPYLNSSLFEPADIEHGGLTISQLKNRELPLHPATVLKDERGRRRTGAMDALAYFFAFLDAYDFSADGGGDIQEENKTLINASVLGLIFEKINGYKDGSFFTPGFITMTMCRETLHRAVLRKFHDAKGWTCAGIPDLAERIDATPEGRAEANRVINSLRICDPAVGSGHFLVSALNEIIALKSDLGILCDRDGRRLKNLHVDVVNDELILTDEDGDFFEYKPRLPESRLIQEALFHEKQTLIENCLFGVDLNPNSVKICRLRLWIELLKHAYYKNDHELETLPNIDINIKCGNSLLSRFALDADLKTALRKSKWTIDSYRRAVMSYRNADSKEFKREMEKLIADIKGDFEAEITYHDARAVKLRKLQGRYNELTLQTRLFAQSAKEKTAWKKEVKSTGEAIAKLEEQLDQIRKNKIYENAFEWRFEFPEVLDNDGSFTGFDILIGNPPYVQIQSLPPDIKTGLADSGYQTFVKSADLYCLFFERALQLLRPRGQLTFITSNKYYRAAYGEKTRALLARDLTLHGLIDFGDAPVFEAIAYASILMGDKQPPPAAHSFPAHTWQSDDDFNHIAKILHTRGVTLRQEQLQPQGWQLESANALDLLQKLRNIGTPLGEYVKGRFYRGVLTGLNEAFVVDQATRDRLLQEDPNSADLLKPYLRGRDVKKWTAQSADLWLIFTRRGVDIDAYPAIKRHLEQFREQLEPKPKDWSGKTWPGRKAGNYEWFHIQDQIAYWEEFEKPKIIIPAITSRPELAPDFSGFYCNNKASIAITDEPHFICAVCNSKIGLWFAKKVFATKQNDSNDYEPRYSSQFPIPPATEAQKAELSALAQACAAATAAKDPTRLQTLETRIDEIVCGLFGVSAEELLG
jgi:adenine-specific DNA-methyltransferase